MLMMRHRRKAKRLDNVHLAAIYTSVIANMILLVMQTTVIANLSVLRSSVLLGFENHYSKNVLYMRTNAKN